MSIFDFDQLIDFSLGEISDQIKRAVETTTTYTWSPQSRSIFSPENVDYKVKLLVPSDTPLRNRIPRTKGSGEAAVWQKMTSKLDPVSTNTSIFFPDGGQPNETTQQYATASAPYKPLGRKIDVGLLAIHASKGRPGGLSNMLEERTNTKILEVMLGEEAAIISADSATNSNAFDGLFKQITTSGTATLLTASGLQQYFATLHDAGGSPDALVYNAKQAQAMADDLTGSGSIQRIVIDNQGGVVSGARVRAVINEIDGTEVETIVSRYVSDKAFILQFKTAAGENCIEMEDLLPLSIIDKDPMSLSMVRYVVELTTLKVKYDLWQMKLSGLATS